MKRILAIILTITLLAGYFPVTSAHATEAEELTVEETTAPTVETEPAAEETEPATELATEQTEPVTEPATEATEPATEETEPAIEPETETTEPAAEETEPATEQTEPVTEPAAEETTPAQITEEAESASITDSLPQSVEEQNDQYLAADTNGRWTLDHDGTFTLNYNFGDYSANNPAPWEAYSSNIKKIVVSSNVNTIGDYSFISCPELTEVVISSGSYLTIGQSAFSSCPKLKTVESHGVLRTIETEAFAYCTSLESIGFPGSSYKCEIGEKAFFYCYNLKTLSIPSEVTISANAFQKCEALDTIYLNSYEMTNKFSADATAFNGVTATVYYPPNSYNYSKWGQSYGGTLTWVCVNQGTCGINTQWSYDPDAKHLTISGTGTIYGTYGSGSRFPWGGINDEILKITVESGIKAIPEYTFEYCEAVETIELPETLTSLNLNAFQDCGSLNNLLLPSSLTAISGTSNALKPSFIRCESLTDLYYFGTGEEWAQVANATKVISSDSEMTIHFLQLHPSGATCTEPGTQPYYQFDDTSVYGGMYDLDKKPITELATVPALDHTYENGVCTACGKIEGLVYTVGNTSVTITDYTGSATELAIPATIEGKPVTAIDAYAFANCSSLTGITLPDGLTSIGSQAFYQCSNLASLTIPASIQTVGSGAFWSCGNLSGTITVPAGVTEIGSHTFSGCSLLEKIVLPSTVKSIGEYAFSNCSALTEINIPTGITELPDGVFNGCSILPKLVIPASVKTIGASAFSGCTQLEGLVIPEGVTTIGEKAFWNCKAMKSLSLPTTLTSVGVALFYQCTSLTDIYVSDISTLMLSGESNRPAHANDLDKNLYLNGELITELEIPEGITEIPNGAFWHCAAITDVHFPESVKTIARSAFGYCNGLTEITLPAKLEEISDWSFGHCENLKSIRIPDSASKIGFMSFGGCSNLMSVVIPASVTEISASAFYNCTKLWHVLYQGTQTQWDAVTVGTNNTNLTDAVLHCNAAGNEVTVSETLNCKGKVLCYCSICKEYVYDTSYTGELGDHTYENGACSVCGELETPLPEGLEYESDEDFVTITDYTGTEDQLEIPAAIGGKPVTTIGEGAYKNCGSLKVLILPASVTNINKNAFYNCGLWHVLFAGTEEQWNAITVAEGNGALTDATVHFQADGDEIIPGTQVSCTELPLLECTECGDILYDETYEGTHNFEDGFCTVCKQGEEYAYAVSDGKVTITDYYGTKTEVDIPATILGMPVVAIGNDAFADCVAVKKITIPAGVTSLGEYAFAYCVKLTSVTIPDSVQSIGAAAFTCCEQLTSVAIPDGVKRIETDTFFNCPKLASVTVPDSVTYIGDYAFGSCYVLKSIYIPEGVTHIGDYAFRFCKALTTIDLPASLENIGECTFSGCHNLKYIEIPVGITQISEEAFHQCWDLVSVTIPVSVTGIGVRAFEECGSLKCVVYPGTAEQKDDISISSRNSDLKNATWHIGGNCCVPAISKVATASSGKPVISWNPVYCAKSYEIYRCTTSKGTYSLVGTTADTSFTDETAAPGALYYYKLKSVSGAGVSSALSGYKSIRCRCGQPDITVEVKASSGKPTVSWEKVEGAKKYEVYRATSEKGKYSKVKTTTALSYTDTKASVGKSYYYKVKTIAASSSANSGYSEIKSCLCICAQPAVTVKIGTTGKPTLSWKKVTGASKYEIYRSYTEDGEYTLLSTQKGLSYTDSALPLDTECFYKVNAIAAVATRNSIDATPKAVHSSCAQPVIKAAADPVTGYPVITWTAVEGAVEYEISCNTKSSGSYTVLDTVTDVSYTDTTAAAGKVYYYKVTAICESGARSVVSSYKSTYCDCKKPDITVEPKASSGKPVVSWTKITGAKKYEVYRATSEKGKYSKVKTTTALSYTDTKASVGKTYFYKVKAIASKSSANSVYSDIKSCLCICAQPAVTVKLNTATGTPELSWKKITGAVSYEVYRATTEDGVYEGLGSQAAVSYKDTAAKADTEYFYKVNAIAADPARNSIDGVPKQVHTTCAQPVVTATTDAATGKPSLEWAAVEGAVSYEITRATKKTGKYTLQATVTEANYLDETAKTGKTYYYKVTAITASGARSATGSYKSAKCLTPAPAVTTWLSGMENVHLQWTEVPGAVKYEIYRSESKTAGYKKLKTVKDTTTFTIIPDHSIIYYFKVRAVMKNGSYSAFSAPAPSINGNMELSGTKLTMDLNQTHQLTADFGEDGFLF